MKTNLTLGLLAATFSPLLSGPIAWGSEEPETVDLDPVVITSADTIEPTKVTFDPKVAIQPLPANDGADALRHIAGISVIRKGGTDGDPTFRGMAGSRLPVVMDGVCTLGGCGMRMDPPTAYVFPSSFDTVTLLKGPQSVLFGPGASAGTILFESSAPRFLDADASLRSFLTVASHDRRDLSVEGIVGNSEFYARVQGSWSEAGDYEDGDGIQVNSSYERWNTQTSLGWTPDDNSSLEFSLSLSDGEASYADRGMDGAQFDRTAYSLRYRSDQFQGPAKSIDAQAYHSYVDHVMDNYSLREFTPTMMMSMPMLSNPDRLTTGGSVKVEFDPWNRLTSTLGVDTQSNRHRVRNAMGAGIDVYQSLAFVEDGNFEQIGVFGEFSYALDEANTLEFGARIDDWSAEDLRQQLRVGMMGGMADNPTAGQTRSAQLTSGFLRLERELRESKAKLYLGFGYSERFPDYWEIFSKESTNSLSAFNVAPERLSQFDLGMLSSFGDFDFSASLYFANYDDYLLIDSGYAKSSSMAMGMESMLRMATVTRSVDASTYGGEIELKYQNEAGWYAGGSLAYTHGTNKTDGGALGQIPPLELKLENGYRHEAWSIGWVGRLVDAQDRFALNQGNIVGQDIGPSDGFAVFSLHSSFRLNETWKLAAGVDNLFDEAYAEHISRAGAMVTGYVQTTRVNEPGRTFWIRMETEL